MPKSEFVPLKASPVHEEDALDEPNSINDNAESFTQCIVLFFSSDDGFAHQIDLTQFLPQKDLKFEFNEVEDVTKRSNYYAKRRVDEETSIYKNRTEVLKELKLGYRDATPQTYTLSQFGEHQHRQWQVCSELNKPFSVFKRLVNVDCIVAASSMMPIVKFYSVFGVCIGNINIEYPLPFTWKVNVNSDLKYLIKSHNARLVHS